MVTEWGKITDANWRVLVVMAIRLANDSGWASKNVVWIPAVIIYNGAGYRRIGRQTEASVGNRRWFQAVNRYNVTLDLLLVHHFVTAIINDC